MNQRTVLIVLCLFVATPAPADETAVMKSELTELFDLYAAAGRFRGAALVALADEVLLAEGYGLADETWQVANTSRTRFATASLSKTFTAATVLVLAERGRLDLDATLDTWLPGVREDVATHVTPRRILNHTSGLRRELFEDSLELFRSHSRAQIVSALNTSGLVFAPGAESGYSNTGYIVLCLIVEEVTGEPFPDVVRRLVFEPAGMKDSGWLDPARTVRDLAAGYDVILGRSYPAERTEPTNHRGAGGLYTTVHDLLAYDRALREGKVLSPETRAARLAHRFRGWGLGWKLMLLGEDEAGEPVFATFHNGDSSGVCSHYFRYADEELVIALLSNESDAPRNELFGRIAAVLDGGEAEGPEPRLAEEIYAAVLQDGEQAGVELATNARAAGRHGAPGAMRAVQVGNTLSRVGDVEGARRVYAYAALFDPEKPWGHLGLGQWYEDQGRPEEAEACYRRVLEHDPEQPHAKAYLEKLDRR